MAGGRYLPRNQAAPVSNSGNTEKTLDFVLRLVAHIKDWRTYLRLSALIWVDWLSAYALYVLMNYLTNVWNLSITHAAGIINIYNGITPALAIVFAVFVDSFLGEFYMLALSSIAYTIGLGLLSLSTPTFFGPCRHYKEECIGHKQKVMFFTALTLIAVGRAGLHVSVMSFINIQIESLAKAKEARDEAEALGRVEVEEVPRAEAEAAAEASDEAEARAEAEAEARARAEDEARAQAKSRYGTGVAGRVCCGITVFLVSAVVIVAVFAVFVGGVIALAYIKPWSIRFGIPAILGLIAVVFFLTGSSTYTHTKPKGSPLSVGLRVFVAAATKDFQQVNKTFTAIYNPNNDLQTDSLRWLNKAAIKYPDQTRSKSWTLCSVREVEDTKAGIRIVPLLLPVIGTGLVLSLGNTYFIEQANHMDRKLGSIKIPIPIFFIFYAILANTSELIHWLFARLIVPLKYHVPSKIAAGMVLSVLCCITAAVVETQRLHVIRNHGLLDKSNETIQMSIFFLLPQFLLLAAVDGLAISGFRRCIKDQVPETMHKYVSYFRNMFRGLGSMANVLCVYVVGKVSESNNNQNWFQHTSNKSHLDRYYWTLAGLSAVNLVIYVIIASFYEYHDNANTDNAITEYWCF